VIITYTSKDASPVAQEVSKQYGVGVHAYRCPGEDSKAVDEFVEKASQEIGEIDVVVANAGESINAALGEIVN
jgi:sorbose reductase